MYVVQGIVTREITIGQQNYKLLGRLTKNC